MLEPITDRDPGDENEESESEETLTTLSFEELWAEIDELLQELGIEGS